MKTKLLFAFIISLAVFVCKGQDSLHLKKNAVYGEFLGNGLAYSINYERMFYQKNEIHFCGRIGIEFVPEVFLFPVEINMLFGKKNNFLETGVGFTFLYPAGDLIGDSQTPLLFLRLGYRFHKQGGGFLFRIAPMLCSPFPYNNKYELFPFAGISVGYTF